VINIAISFTLARNFHRTTFKRDTSMPGSKQNGGATVVLPKVQGSPWLAEHVANIDRSEIRALPKIAFRPTRAGDGEFDLWDMWPIETPDGRTFELEGNSIWMALSAPRQGDPELRHNVARIRLLVLRDGCWIDAGPLFPDGFTPGSREWSGSSIVEPSTGRVTVFFTAAGRRDEQEVSVEQRIFETTGELRIYSRGIAVTDWTTPVECLVADSNCYLRVRRGPPVPGKIKAFRDPAYFLDPERGEQHLFFTGSAAGSTSHYNGVIGVAIAADGAWHLRPPVVSADGLNNELERPHMRYFDGAYYLFWSTQRKVFAPGTPSGPTGLYGMVGKSPLGPFEPLNGSALVAPNPEVAPFQNYSWWVLPDLRVCSFIDYPQLQTAPDGVSVIVRRQNFGGIPAPFFSLELRGAEASVVGE
jgi:levansucrase